jgi:hypothetical protein
MAVSAAEKVMALVRLATDPGSSEQEARTAAVAACKLIRENGLVVICQHNGSHRNHSSQSSDEVAENFRKHSSQSSDEVAENFRKHSSQSADEVAENLRKHSSQSTDEAAENLRRKYSPPKRKHTTRAPQRKSVGDILVTTYIATRCGKCCLCKLGYEPWAVLTDIYGKPAHATCAFVQAAS